jgi:hypothetical protein
MSKTIRELIMAERMEEAGDSNSNGNGDHPICTLPSWDKQGCPSRSKNRRGGFFNCNAEFGTCGWQDFYIEEKHKNSPLKNTDSEQSVIQNL